MGNIYESLINLGYPVREESGDYYRLPALYRGGKTKTSLSVHKKTGYFADFGNNTTGSWRDFLGLVLHNDQAAIKEFEGAQTISFNTNPLQSLNYMSHKVYDPQCLEKLLPFYEFYQKRGISVKTQQLFKCGLATNGLMRNRIVFPIFNLQKQIIGFAGRNATNNDSYPKWILKGTKKQFVYPAFLNKNIIKEKEEIILVESIGDLLSLWESGIFNVWCLFGLDLGNEVLKQLIELAPKKIVLGLNNDENSDDENHGQIASENILKKLHKFFDPHRIMIVPPTKKDFGEMNKSENQNWYLNLCQK